MKLPRDGTNELSKDGFDWITLKVIFQGPNGRERVKCGCFVTFGQFSQKRSDNFFSFCIQFLWDYIDQLSRYGFIFDWIILKDIFKVGNVRFGPFSHNYWYYSVVTKCVPNLLHHESSLVGNQAHLKIWKVWNYSKRHFQDQKGPTWTFVIYSD